jgi:Di-N-acetylchitobiase
MRSQVYYQCLAAANSPRALVEQGLREFLFAYHIDPTKLVLGVPWYGYKYTCETFSAAQSLCAIKPMPFFDAPCSDASGSQIDYGDIENIRKRLPSDARHWDAMSQTPFLQYEENGVATQLWFDDEQSLRLKYALVKSLGIRGVGMWNADTLDYAGDADGARRMWHAMEAIY